MRRYRILHTIHDDGSHSWLVERRRWFRWRTVCFADSQLSAEIRIFKDGGGTWDTEYETDDHITHRRTKGV